MTRASLSLAILGLVGLATAQFTVDPPTRAPDDTIQDCTNWHVGSAGEKCADIADENAITLDQLYRYNPSLKSSCSIEDGISYCVEENWGIPPPVTTTVESTTTASSTGIVTPQPTQPPAIVDGCTKFHFVEKGTGCEDVLKLYGLTIAQLYAWNSGVGPECRGLWSEVYVCVAGPGGPPTITTTVSSTSTGGNGIATPSPTQPPSIVSNCNKFYFVQPGTSCNKVLSDNAISLAQLFAWNSGVNADCSGMWASVYLCVGVIGGGPSTTLKTTASTTSGNGIVTPTPTQDGMVGDCDKFHFVAKGQTCSDVLKQYSLSLPQFYAWNKGVGSDCAGMWAQVYVCVHAQSGTIPTTTTTTTTTTTGNGITTPTPTQPGMVDNCNKFYKVASGDTCDTITSKTGVSKANLLAWNKELGAACNVWLDYYLCVGLR